MKNKLKKIMKEKNYLKLKSYFFTLVKKLNLEKLYLEKKFKQRLGYELDFNKTPETFNQKIQFRKLFDNNPLYSLCADKYRVREYVKSKIGEEYLIPLFLVTKKLTEDQFDKLPEKTVIKANHNSGPVQIIFDKKKSNKFEIINELNNQLLIKYGIASMEKYYNEIEPLIIAEELLEDENGNIPNDYKFHCFNNNNGCKCFIQVIGERNEKGYRADFYDENWNRLGFHLGGELYDRMIEKPKNMNEMIAVAKKLSSDFDYARIDLYSIKNKIYFGEITFCPNSGLKSFKPKEWDFEFGKFWNQKIVE